MPLKCMPNKAPKMLNLVIPPSGSSPLLSLLLLFGISASSIIVYEKFLRSSLLTRLEQLKHKATPLGEDATTTDPPLLKKHSNFYSYTTPYATYPRVRTFYHEHPQAEKLPEEAKPLPLLVFVHGLGGSLAQLAPIMGSLVNVAPSVGIDFPGCGLSGFSPSNWEAYTLEAMAALLNDAVKKHRVEGQGVVLIAHSLGCSISATLISKTSRISCDTREHILALVALCPPASNPSPKQLQTFRRLLSVPTPLFNILRWWDRRGGLDSNSVRRITGGSAGVDTRKLQMRFNEQSQTPVWRRMAWGSLPTQGPDGKFQNGLPSREVWAGVDVPVSFIAGEADTVTKPENVDILIQYMRGEANSKSGGTLSKVNSLLPDASLDKPSLAKVDRADERHFGLQPSSQETHDRKRLIKSTLLPAPASHALIYDHATYRTVAGLISDFLISHVSPHLSLGWQLQQLTTSGKWDVKNLAKWQGVAPVSSTIGQGDIFRALKTLREQDEEHTPIKFARMWHRKIFALIDISHDSPIYDPGQLEKGGIQYHKFPTVSKIPPTVAEVQDFIALVERLRAEIAEVKNDSKPTPAIGVHCHYGYNRTGFFIVCYLVEKQGYSVQDAVDEFERKRPPGIRHDHFIDTLWVRYSVGLKKAPTIQE